ncbi:hypothetical protein [Candidatus Soleaferrea massiliensis]|uniref:hypothetical protein n=1 Tax=Candidatus Soleaferrea massiliensis TaxID=1470354 RepID=UPI00058FFD37|nr:hypothetical protein [Candidatus Soleaferrea massiliensis]
MDFPSAQQKNNGPFAKAAWQMPYSRCMIAIQRPLRQVSLGNHSETAAAQRYNIRNAKVSYGKQIDIAALNEKTTIGQNFGRIRRCRCTTATQHRHRTSGRLDKQKEPVFPFKYIKKAHT